ncbi:hypothetical protein [Achromobacter insuavis]|uniref:Uncharacterized protein n=1 Tax=Achromobacter insuavis AXX-A TaxID=1003200 RepID=F7T214_9BURK|nr:hypothetical protein [Achromobacter insuavis]EGP45639.1 hypothetical protein AXXA_14868 [Achromobacter insuavis AXX-A]
MHSESSGNINYWPGFVDAFSNLVLALVFVIVILAMSLGMFSGLMAKMAIQRALIEQRLDESKTVPGSPAAGQDGGVSAGGKDLAAQAGTQPADPGRGGRSETVDAADTADAAGGADVAGGTGGPAGPDGPNGADGSGGAKAQASQSVQWASGPVGNDLRPGQAEGADGDAPGMPPPVMPAAVRAAPASGVGAASASGVDAGAGAGVGAAVGAGEGVARDETTRGRDERAAASAGTSAQAREHTTLRRENDALRQELAALRKKQAELAQRAAGAAPGSGSVAAGGNAEGGNALGASAAGGNAAGNAEAGGGHPKSADKFGPTMPEDDHSFRQRIEDDLQRTLKEFEARRDSGVSIDVVIYVPNYALTENKRTALFYLISIKDYLMKRKVLPGQIRMHMAPASAGQKDMTVSMSVEP